MNPGRSLARRRFTVSNLSCLRFKGQDLNYNRYPGVYFVTAYETALRNPSEQNEVDVLILAASRGYINLYNTFTGLPTRTSTR